MASVEQRKLIYCYHYENALFGSVRRLGLQLQAPQISGSTETIQRSQTLQPQTLGRSWVDANEEERKLKDNSRADALTGIKIPIKSINELKWFIGAPACSHIQNKAFNYNSFRSVGLTWPSPSEKCGFYFYALIENVRRWISLHQ